MSRPPLPSRRLGDYELLDELGSGGMGVVYRARHVQTRVEYALKVLRSSDVELVARFQREGESMARVDDHPHIARVRSLQREGRTSYLVMDVANGGNLEQRLRAGVPPVDQAVAWIQDLAGALAYAHAQGVLHRDLKPSNVLFMDEVPLLSDFGLAKLVGAQSLTATGSMLGTPAYMAPEQVAGEKDRIGPASDVYGLGALLYHCLTGQPPFRGSSNLDTLQRVLSEPPPTPRALRPEVPPALEAVCLQALAKDPRERFPSAAAFAEALAESVAAPRPPAKRTGLLVTLGLLGAITLGAGMAARRSAASAASPDSTPTTAPRTPAETQRPDPPTPADTQPAGPPRPWLDPDYARPCPGSHPMDVACVTKLNLHLRHEEARDLALQILSGRPCLAHAAALRELAVAIVFSPDPDLASVESYLLLATRLRDPRACYNLGVLWLPEEWREEFYAGPLLHPDTDRAASALWLASAWKPETNDFERTLDRVPRSARPRSEDEALQRVFSVDGDPRAPAPPPPPTQRHAMWARPPEAAAEAAYQRFVDLRAAAEKGEPEAREAARQELRRVVLSPPSWLHRKGYLQLATFEHQAHGTTERCVQWVVRAALIGSGKAAATLAAAYSPVELTFAPRQLEVDHDLELALAFASVARATGHDDDRGAILRLVTSLEERNHVIPPPGEAYRTVWRAFPDAR